MKNADFFEALKPELHFPSNASAPQESADLGAQDELTSSITIVGTLEDLLGREVTVLKILSTTPFTKNEDILESTFQCVKRIRGYFELVPDSKNPDAYVANKYIPGVLARDEVLRKPLIIIMRADAFQRAYNKHWVSVIIVPAHYQPPYGVRFTNTTEQIFLLDSVGTHATENPSAVLQALTKGLQKKPHWAMHPPFPNASIHIPTNNLFQQELEEDSRWWVVYNTAMLLARGPDFLEHFRQGPRRAMPGHFVNYFRPLLGKLRHDVFIEDERKSRCQASDNRNTAPRNNNFCDRINAWGPWVRTNASRTFYFVRQFTLVEGTLRLSRTLIKPVLEYGVGHLPSKAILNAWILRKTGSHRVTKATDFVIGCLPSADLTSIIIGSSYGLFLMYEMPLYRMVRFGITSGSFIFVRFVLQQPDHRIGKLQFKNMQQVLIPVYFFEALFSSGEAWWWKDSSIAGAAFMGIVNSQALLAFTRHMAPEWRETEISKISSQQAQNIIVMGWLGYVLGNSGTLLGVDFYRHLQACRLIPEKLPHNFDSNTQLERMVCQPGLGVKGFFSGKTQARLEWLYKHPSNDNRISFYVNECKFFLFNRGKSIQFEQCSPLEPLQSKFLSIG